MARFKSKYVEIDAVQYHGDNLNEVKSTFPDAEFREHLEFGEYVEVLQVWDHLQKTWVSVNFGDYIIKGLKGEYYPCAEDVFIAKYESVDENRDENEMVNIVINTCVDPERIAAEVIKQLRERKHRVARGR